MMKKQFVLLQAARDLENYISRERYHLSKMEDNYNIPHALLVTNVSHFNDLVHTLNRLFGSLIESDEMLFEPYRLAGEENEEFSYQETTHRDTPTDTYMDEGPTTHVEEPVYEPKTVEEIVSEKPEEVIGESELEDAEEEFEEVIDESDDDEGVSEETEEVELEEVKHESDIDVESFDDGVQDEISMKSADDMLTDYERTSEQDITSYDPELDEPTEVLQLMSDEEESDEDLSGMGLLSEENIRYLNHTADNQRVNDDPIQIADTLTAVEKHGGKSQIKGTDTHLADLLESNSVSFDVDNLIKEDFDKLYVERGDTDEDSSDVGDTEEVFGESEELESHDDSEEFDHDEQDESEEVFLDSDEDFVLEDEHHDDGYDENHDVDDDEGYMDDHDEQDESEEVFLDSDEDFVLEDEHHDDGYDENHDVDDDEGYMDDHDEQDESEEVFLDSDEDFVLEDEHHDDDYDENHDVDDDEGDTYDE